MKVRRSAEADNDLNEIWLYIAHDSARRPIVWRID